MLGIPELKQAVKDASDASMVAMSENTKALNELRRIISSLSELEKAHFIDTNRRLSLAESVQNRITGALDALRDFEESHATYVMHSVNGFEKRERTAHDCALCVAARKYF